MRNAQCNVSSTGGRRDNDEGWGPYLASVDDRARCRTSTGDEEDQRRKTVGRSNFIKERCHWAQTSSKNTDEGDAKESSSTGTDVKRRLRRRTPSAEARLRSVDKRMANNSGPSKTQSSSTEDFVEERQREGTVVKSFHRLWTLKRRQLSGITLIPRPNLLPS